jgi:hypothetical protein
MPIWNPPSPELADLVKQDVERGAYASIDEYVEQALSMLNEQEAWSKCAGSARPNSFRIVGPLHDRGGPRVSRPMASLGHWRRKLIDGC